jgi:hypothetical protein
MVAVYFVMFTFVRKGTVGRDFILLMQITYKIVCNLHNNYA